MNEVIKNIKERRSVRKFKADMPSKADFKVAGMFKSGIIFYGIVLIAGLSMLW